MNICVLTHTFPRFSGDPVAPFMKDFCLGLYENGNSVFLLAPYDKRFAINDVPKINVSLFRYIIPSDLHVLGYSRTLIGDQKLKPLVYLLGPLFFLFSFIDLLKLVKTNNIQVISAHWIIPNGFIGALVSKITGVPLVITVPGSDVYLAKKNLLFRYMTLFAGKQARYIASNSMRYLDELKNIGLDSKKFIEIPYGVDIKKIRLGLISKSEAIKKYPSYSNYRIILAVGRLVEKKGFEYLVKAIPEVLKKHKNTKLIIIGDGYEKNKLIDIITSLGIQDNVVLIGKINHTDLPKYYSLADIYVAPSIKDSKGNLESHIVALFEAISTGLPVVSTTLGVNQTYIKEGENGYRVEEKDEKALAKAIIALLDKPDLETMKKESKSIADKYLSYRVTTKAYSDLFKEIV